MAFGVGTKAVDEMMANLTFSLCFHSTLYRAFKSAKVKQLPYNIALRLSFGAERELALKDGSTNIHIPQTNNSVCTLGRDVNVRFEHELDRAYEDAGASICLRIYGKAKNVTEEEGSPELLEDGSGEEQKEPGDSEAE